MCTHVLRGVVCKLLCSDVVPLWQAVVNKCGKAYYDMAKF